MYDIVAIVLEVFTIYMISNQLYTNEFQLSKGIAAIAFGAIYAVVNQYITNISTVCHYLVFAGIILTVHSKVKKWVAPFAALVGYAVLIYLQAVCLRWFSAEWLSLHYELAGLVINIIVFLMACMIVFVMKKLKVDILYFHLKWWQVLMTSLIAIGVILFCFVYKPILEEQYYIDSYVWICFVGVVLFASLLMERQSSRIKNKQIITELQKKIDIEYRKHHDYIKQLKILEQADGQLAEEVLNETKQEEYLQNLPDYAQKVMESYLTECREKGIVLKLDVPEPIVLWKLNLKDTISVLGNLMENAVEAVEKISDQEKWINVSFRDLRENHNLEIYVQNPIAKGEKVNGANVTHKGVSTKGIDRGYGLYIAEKKLKVCSGSLRIFVEDEMFTVAIDLPDV